MSDIPRLVAWRRQLLEAHTRLRLALAAARDAARQGGDIANSSRSHFRFEERELEPLLEQLQLQADPDAVFGPL